MSDLEKYVPVTCPCLHSCAVNSTSHVASIPPALAKPLVSPVHKGFGGRTNKHWHGWMISIQTKQIPHQVLHIVFLLHDLDDGSTTLNVLPQVVVPLVPSHLLSQFLYHRFDLP